MYIYIYIYHYRLASIGRQLLVTFCFPSGFGLLGIKVGTLPCRFLRRRHLSHRHQDLAGMAPWRRPQLRPRGAGTSLARQRRCLPGTVPDHPLVVARRLLLQGVCRPCAWTPLAAFHLPVVPCLRWPLRLIELLRWTRCSQTLMPSLLVECTRPCGARSRQLCRSGAIRLSLRHLRK